jgi:protein-ribulosamine 3-kinase
MLLPEAILTRVASLLFEKSGKRAENISSTSVGGGSINETFRLTTSIGYYFLKYNFADRFPGMFENEAKGLEILRNGCLLTIPSVIGFDKEEIYSFLLLELITPASKTLNFWQDFAQGLAALHRNTSDYYGLDLDNYMGSLSQSNRQHKDWNSFFIEERLEKQVKLGRDNGEIPLSIVHHFEKLYRVLPEIVPGEPPALLHGDLWSGNFMTGPDGKACLIDPAVYYGHRESDIAMTQLFGGFSSEFYTEYNRAFPLAKGWEKRVDILNLYPLLIHVNLFGGGYLGQVKRIVERF